MRGIVVTLSRSLHNFRWCWGGATSPSRTNLPTLTHALQYRTEWSFRIICLHVPETNSGQFRGMKWRIPGMHLNVRSPVLEATHDHYMTEILSHRFAQQTESWVCTEEKYKNIMVFNQYQRLHEWKDTTYLYMYALTSVHSIMVKRFAVVDVAGLVAGTQFW